jgi:hypothetical protein
VKLLATYRGSEAQRFALEPPPYNAEADEVGRKKLGRWEE